jgi:hypothetical protein
VSAGDGEAEYLAHMTATLEGNGFTLTETADGDQDVRVLLGERGAVEMRSVPIGDSGWHQLQSWALHSVTPLTEPVHYHFEEDQCQALGGRRCYALLAPRGGKRDVYSGGDLWSLALMYEGLLRNGGNP